MDEQSAWEEIFASSHPITYERLKQSQGRKSNAIAFLKTTRDNIWKALMHTLKQSDLHDRVVWDMQDRHVATNLADEFGVDCLHRLAFEDKKPVIQSITLGDDLPPHAIQSVRRFFDLQLSNALQNSPMNIVQLWTVPFQDAVIVKLQSPTTLYCELIWIRTSAMSLPAKDRDLSLWAINHNNLAENPQDFRAPPFLDGDKTLGPTTTVLLSSTEGRRDLVHVNTACASVILRHRDVLFFDQVKQASADDENPRHHRHWRHLLTDEVWEPKAIPVCSSCFVFDSILLFASHDGVLRAHPRGNPKSTYHVEEFRSVVPHMTSLYNVVALIHSFDILEVRHVIKSFCDPFVQFRILYITKGVDCRFAPLLYGPYVVFRSLADGGTWYRVNYENSSKHQHQQQQEHIKIPHYAGWNIVAIKNANWRYWTLTLQSPHHPKSTTSDFMLMINHNKSSSTCEA